MFDTMYHPMFVHTLIYRYAYILIFTMQQPLLVLLFMHIPINDEYFQLNESLQNIIYILIPNIA